jgi:hypothetical protein
VWWRGEGRRAWSGKWRAKGEDEPTTPLDNLFAKEMVKSRT